MKTRNKVKLTTTLLVTIFLFTGCIQQLDTNGGIINNGGSESDSNWQKPEPPTPPSINATNLEMLTHNLVNEERVKRGLNELKWNSEIAAVARQHSQYLADLEQNQGFTKDIYISHTGEDGKTHGYRIEKNEIYYTNGSGENVAGISAVDKYYSHNNTPTSYTNTTQIAHKATEGWMESPGHKKNILTESFEEAGMGVATDSTGTNYILTQVFINRANCGYRYGECCENQDCFTGLKCKQGTCLTLQEINELN